MLSKAKKYVECGATASPPDQRRRPPISAKPNSFSFLLLVISNQLDEEEDKKNFKAFLEDYGREDDKGVLTTKQLQKVTAMYSLLMESAKVGYIQPDDLSNLEVFLDICGHCALVQEIRDYQKERSKCTLLQC